MFNAECKLDWEDWQQQFTRICDHHAPIRVKRIKKHSTPWIDKVMAKKFYERDFAKLKFNETKDPFWKSRYEVLKREASKALDDKKTLFFIETNNLGSSDRPRFWQNLKTLMPKINFRSIPRNLSSEKFNAYFSTVASNIDKEFSDVNEPSWRGGTSTNNFSLSVCSTELVLKELTLLGNLPNLDVLGMDRKLLYISRNEIAPSLCFIYNQSINFSVVHSDFKKARVTPVFKEGKDCCIDNPSDYRPISIICHIAKILERLIKTQLMSYLDENHLISPDQSAYLKNHSTQTSLHRVLDDIYESINEGEFAAACVFDISKCFDTINHKHLLFKLEKYGIRGAALDWFESYLTDRSQAVMVNNKLSGFRNLFFGVPQGSVLGPFLFLLFINDISNAAIQNCQLNLFADDLIAYTSDKDINTLKYRLQTCVTNIGEWYRANRLKVNPGKSKLIFGSQYNLDRVDFESFKVNLLGPNIPLVDELVYLSITITSNLSWSKHIAYMSKCINFKLVQLKQLSELDCPRSLLLQIYKSYIQPKFDYGITIWGCTSRENIYKVQRLQNRAARIISNCYDYSADSGLNLLVDLGLHNITERRDFFLSKLVFSPYIVLCPIIYVTELLCVWTFVVLLRVVIEIWTFTCLWFGKTFLKIASSMLGAFYGMLCQVPLNMSLTLMILNVYIAN